MSGFGLSRPEEDELMARLLTLVENIEDFQNEHTERLSFEDYENFNEYAAQLRTLADLIGCRHPVAYIYATIGDASEYLSDHIFQRVPED